MKFKLVSAMFGLVLFMMVFMAFALFLLLFSELTAL